SANQIDEIAAELRERVTRQVNLRIIAAHIPAHSAAEACVAGQRDAAYLGAGSAKTGIIDRVTIVDDRALSAKAVALDIKLLDGVQSIGNVGDIERAGATDIGRTSGGPEDAAALLVDAGLYDAIGDVEGAVED